MRGRRRGGDDRRFRRDGGGGLEVMQEKLEVLGVGEVAWGRMKTR
jgi:hypothetical protein